MHLALLNIAHMRAPKESPEMADFVAALEPLNILSDSAPGFVWRLKGGDEPTDTVTHEYGDHLLVNFSVWESRDSVWDYTYRSAHLPTMKRRREWFHRMTEMYMVLWWIPEGEIPSLAEGMARLDLLRAQGPGPEAFTFTEFFEHSEADRANTGN